MSYTSYSRLRAGIEEPTHTISQPVVPEAIDLARTPRKRSGGRAPVAAAAPRGGPLAGNAAFTNDLIANAQRAKKPGEGKVGKAIDTGLDKVRDYAFRDDEPSLKDATLKSYTDAAERTASQPTGRHAYVIPRTGEAVTATRNSRNYPEYPDADGPLGSFGDPAGGFLAGRLAPSTPWPVTSDGQRTRRGEQSDGRGPFSRWVRPRPHRHDWQQRPAGQQHGSDRADVPLHPAGFRPSDPPLLTLACPVRRIGRHERRTGSTRGR